jgi:citrate lyase subunit beta/citryl-CoA lyase
VAAATLAAANPRVARFAFGATDFLADIGARGPADGEATLHARSRLVLVSRAAAIGPPIDTVHTTIDDVAGLRRSAERARDLGFFGKSLIHPGQIPVVHEVFTSTAEELERARAVVVAFEEAAAEGRAATVVAGEFVDPAVVARSRALLRLAKRPVGSRGRT